MSARVLLVGEDNPYGSDPAYALYPLPEHASGGRLQRILGLTRSAYLRDHERVNLCDGRWALRAATARAQQLHASRQDGTGVVLLGTRVALAFRRAAAYTDDEFAPFTLARYETVWYLTLPHPSGRNRAWNASDAVLRAREGYERLRALVGVAA